MRSENCQKAIDIILYLEDRSGQGKVTTDSGGLTKWGISQRAFPDLNIASLTREDAARLYEAHYWRPLHCDALPWPLAAYVFDAAVNQGPGAAKRLLNETRNPEAFMALREERYRKTKGFDKYGKGWLSRLKILTERVNK